MTDTNGAARWEQPPPPVSHARLWIAVTGLVLCGTAVLAATMWPTPLDRGYESAIQRFLEVLHRNGVPTWFGYRKLEFTANICMFIPLGFFLLLALRRATLWVVVPVVPLVSAAIELTQAVALAERFASPLDVVANTLGGYLGAAVAALIRVGIGARDRKMLARALWEARMREEGRAW